MLDQVADAELQLREAPEDLRAYLRDEFKRLLNRPDIDECIYVHLEPRFATQRTQRIIQLLTNLIDQ